MPRVGRRVGCRFGRYAELPEDMREVARRAKEGDVGTIRFGVTQALGPYIMSDVISSLRRDQPGLSKVRAVTSVRDQRENIAMA